MRIEENQIPIIPISHKCPILVHRVVAIFETFWPTLKRNMDFLVKSMLGKPMTMEWLKEYWRTQGY